MGFIYSTENPFHYISFFLYVSITLPENSQYILLFTPENDSQHD